MIKISKFAKNPEVIPMEEKIKGKVRWKNLGLEGGEAVHVIMVFGELIDDEFIANSYLIDETEYVWGALAGAYAPLPDYEIESEIYSYTLDPGIWGVDELTVDVIVFIKEHALIYVDEVYSEEFEPGQPRMVGIRVDKYNEWLKDAYDSAIFEDVCTVSVKKLVKIEEFDLEEES
jgi:hypothetical protein